MIRPTLACNSDEPHAAHDWFYELLDGPQWRTCPGWPPIDGGDHAPDDDWQDFGLARRDDGVYLLPGSGRVA